MKISNFEFQIKPPFSRFQISGHSMEPTLKEGQVVWVNHWVYLFSSPKANDVVLFQHHGQDFVKRVKEVMGNKLVLTGDNTQDSFDSRQFGTIIRNQILGKIIL